MRICIDLTSLDDNFSGIERYAASLASEMIKDQSNEYILVFKNKIHSMFQKKEINVDMIIIPGSNKLWFNQIRLPYNLNRIEADYYLFLAFPVPILFFKKNIVSTIHDICCWDCPETMNGLSKWYFRISHRIAIKKCKRIITISDFSKDRIIEKLKYSPDKVWLIYCGIDKKFLYFKKNFDLYKEVQKKYCLPEEYILSLCTLEPRKNLRLLVEAYSKYCNETDNAMPLVLAGRRGWKVDALLDGVDERTLGNIVFTGFIDEDELPVIYGHASCFVFPSKYEGFGMPPIEALACGTRVICSDSSSLPEVLGSTALFFENEKLDSLVLALKKFSTYKMDKEKREEVIERYDWGKEASKLLRLMGEKQ